ncbi:hypothetical protein ACWDUL_39580 [Nocardia niigatensis]
MAERVAAGCGARVAGAQGNEHHSENSNFGAIGVDINVELAALGPTG